jgi:diguanylate cyclase (GGDEF)-like protein
VDKSLLQSNSSGKYTIQPLLRQYAAERLSEFIDTTTLAGTEINTDVPITTRDPVTNLPNKILFRDFFLYALKRAKRHQLNVILLIIDVKSIKNWSQSTQKSKPDFLNTQIIEPITQTIRESDIFARLTEDKFAIILEDIPDLDHAPILIQKIRAAIHLQNHSEDEHEKKIIIGMSTYPNDGDDVSTLMNCAISNLQ